MHGVTKADFLAVDEEKRISRAKKTEQYKALAKEVLRRRAARIYDDKSFALTSKLLEVNPECYTVWNFRREMLNKTFAASAEAERRPICDRELQVRLPLASAARAYAVHMG
jgi:geranylgeranyl transferase type-2 subunit alpha